MKTDLHASSAEFIENHRYLVVFIVDRLIKENQYVLLEYEELIELGMKALANAFKLFEAQGRGDFESFATPIVQDELKKSFPQPADPDKSGNPLFRKVLHTIDLESIDTRTRPRPNQKTRKKIEKFVRSNVVLGFTANMEKTTVKFKTKKGEGTCIADKKPLSTFSTSVDTASYYWVKNKIQKGYIPQKNEVRTEELINFFDYDYPQPDENEIIGLAAEVAACPWNVKNRLVKIALKAKDVEYDQLPPSHMVFLVDVSGSMIGSDRLELVKKSLILLTNKIRPFDKVSVVVFSDKAKVLLNNAGVNNIEFVQTTIRNLYASGGTNGAGAIQLAYKVAKENFIEGGNNRVILCTDGDFNIGISNEDDLKEFIRQKSDKNIFLSVFGFGMGNFKDVLVKTLALSGRGNYAYISSMTDAGQAMINMYSGSFYAMAKDVKVQVEFNPVNVYSYRLIGYETNMLADADFNDDDVEAGLLGVGQKVTVLYEIVPKSNQAVDPLKYILSKREDLQPYPLELMTVKIRYKLPEKDESKKIELVVEDQATAMSPDFQFASAVALFGQILTKSKHVRKATMNQVIELAKPVIMNDQSGLRHEFVRIAELVGGIG